MSNAAMMVSALAPAGSGGTVVSVWGRFRLATRQSARPLIWRLVAAPNRAVALLSRTRVPRGFVVRAEPSERISVWEHEGVTLPWASIKTTVLTIALGLGGLLILTQAQLVGAWIGLVPTLAPAVPAVLKMVNGVQRGSKPEGASA